MTLRISSLTIVVLRTACKTEVLLWSSFSFANLYTLGSDRHPLARVSARVISKDGDAYWQFRTYAFGNMGPLWISGIHIGLAAP
jgi:hypothetical protein